MNLKDGVYQVHRYTITAGFTVKDGKVAECAPVLRTRFAYWQQFAYWVGPLKETDDESSS